MPIRHLTLMALLGAALMATRADVAGQAGGSNELSRDLVENNGTYFVELASAPTIDGTSLAQVRAEKAAFRRAAAAAGVAIQPRFEFDTLWNGVSVRVNRGRAAELTRLPGVRAVYPVEAVPIPETSPGNNPELFSALSMTGADIAQSELGLSGRGIRVAVMDTGVDYHHPDLGGCFGPGCRVAVGYDFVGDKYDANPDNPTYNPVPVPDPNPDDCNGHGTHVAGIVGADGFVRGVAPEVTFAAYKVFGCEGSTDSDVMIAAMERAWRDGADVLNMSIGASYQWPQYPTAQAADRLVRRGVVVVASAGNAGTSGLYAASAPSVGDLVISVASFDNVQELLPFFTISPDAQRVGFSAATGAPAPPTSGSGTFADAGFACAPLPAGSLTDRIALVERGAPAGTPPTAPPCTFYLKAINAQNAGATGVVIFNNTVGRVSPTVAPTPPAPPVTIPVVAITQAGGQLIRTRLAGGPVVLTWTDLATFFSNTATGNRISSFSSWGPAPDLSVKPDLGAPGGSIFSTYPLEQGGYASVSGTSMASPHVAGAAALMLEARPYTRAGDVRALLQATAEPRPFSTFPFHDSVHRQGAGMLDIDDAITQTATVEPSKLALGESEAGPATRRLTLRNIGPGKVTYTLSHVAALATGPSTFAVSLLNAPSTVTFSAATVTIKPGGKTSVDVTIAPNPGLLPRSVYGGYIVLTANNGAEPLRVPYVGFKGDYQSIQVLTPLLPAPDQLPWLAKLTGNTFVRQTDGAVFTMTGNDIPHFIAHFDHPSRRMRLTLTNLTTGRSWARLLQEEYLPRNASQTGLFDFPWDGRVELGRVSLPVPDGEYQVTITVLKALGDGRNPAHTETWVSPRFTIDRP